MNHKLQAALNEVVITLKDRSWHDIYELHCRYNLSVSLIIEACNLLVKYEIIICKENKIKLADDLGNDKLSLINKIQKTKKPDFLLIDSRYS